MKDFMEKMERREEGDGTDLKDISFSLEELQRKKNVPTSSSKELCLATDL